MKTPSLAIKCLTKGVEVACDNPDAISNDKLIIIGGIILTGISLITIVPIIIKGRDSRKTMEKEMEKMKLEYELKK